MTNLLMDKENGKPLYQAECEKCFGLCCVALPYAKSADFAFDKDGGTPCRNLQSNYQCQIHQNLREKGFRGCAVYECFGAGQKVSQITYRGKDWREDPELAGEIFEVFPVMQQLHEMLYYLHEALHRNETHTISEELYKTLKEIEELTALGPNEIRNLNVPTHREGVNKLFLVTSEKIRSRVSNKSKVADKISQMRELIGANLRRSDLRGVNLRGALLIAADLRESDLRMADFIGADLRDADLSGANLSGAIFLTQAQVNSAKGDEATILPTRLSTPIHWLTRNQ
ncbi:pentapeptide repeat-containing protein [Cytobacillus sp. Hz8]|uniref:pentapeptide repeat-containing protein n=1 Tax=Cytobacillus sp. Hz8 TaxID=3347168 RepID=UPI0035D57CD1